MPVSTEGRLRGVGRLVVTVAVLSATVLALLPAAAGAQSRAGRFAAGIVHRLNAIRADRGLGRLWLDDGLTRAAAAHSVEMMRDDYFSHDSASGAAFSTRVRRWVPQQHLGETIAWGSGRPRPATIVRAWMHSAPHRETLMTASFRRIGVASASGRLFGRSGVVVTADLAG